MTSFLNHPVFKTISEIIDQEHSEAYVIGGFVRDLLLKKRSKDIDIVMIGDGIKLAENVAKKLRLGKVSIFKKFGTAMIKSNDIEIEFVGARKESYSSSSRNPIVECGSLSDDQNRRDFSINAMAISLRKSDFGKFLDPFNGIDDLKNKIIRTPLDPNITFSDDPLRMFRAIRFATQLDFTIEEATFNAISNNIDRIKIISKERIIDELNKIILSPIPSIGFKLLDSAGILKIILPELSALKGVETKEGKAHKENFYHSLAVLDNLSVNSQSLWLRWAALLHDIGKVQTKRFNSKQGWTFHGHDYLGSKMTPLIFKRLKLPLDNRMKYVQKIIALHLRPIVLSQEIVTDSAIRRLLFDAGDDIDDLMILCEADITSQNRTLVRKHLKNFKIVRTKLKKIEAKDAVRNFEPPLSGNEIINIFNIQPSKEIGIIKESIKDAILDGIIGNNHEEAYHYMLRKAKELGLTKSTKNNKQ